VHQVVFIYKIIQGCPVKKTYNSPYELRRPLSLYTFLYDVQITDMSGVEELIGIVYKV